MFSQIESKLTALVADRLTTRTHLTVVEAPGPPPSLNPGKGAVLVSVIELTPATAFAPTQIGRTGLQSRRVVPVELVARVELALRPAAGPDGPAAARALLLDDLSLVIHALAEPTVATGQAFVVAAPDPGFRVLSFALERGAVARDLEGQTLSASLRYLGQGEIWPPGVSSPEGEIRAVDTVLVPLPLELAGARPSARPGQSRVIRVGSLAGQRLATIQPRQTQPLRLAVTVLSDAPPAQRGVIEGGVPGTETGVRVLPVTQPETAITYRAPAAGLTTARSEYVAIHLATPDGGRGVFLGSSEVRLEP